MYLAFHHLIQTDSEAPSASQLKGWLTSFLGEKPLGMESDLQSN
jgi:hypothetical protein